MASTHALDGTSHPKAQNEKLAIDVHNLEAQLKSTQLELAQAKKDMETSQQSHNTTQYDLTVAQEALGNSLREKEHWQRAASNALEEADGSRIQLMEELSQAKRDLEASEERYFKLAAEQTRSIGSVPKVLWDQVEPYFNKDMGVRGW